MRILALAVSALVAASLAQRPAAAAFNLPWCAQYSDRSGIRSCAFYTFQQCRATVSGVGGYCFQNPWGPPIPVAVPSVPRRTKHSHAGLS
jgi:uncharacterized protein DUF3551